MLATPVHGRLVAYVTNDNDIFECVVLKERQGLVIQVLYLCGK